MELQIQRGCGLDVHQATVVACLLTVLADGKVKKQIRAFGTTTRELLALSQWLQGEGCTHVAMESTGVYWKPVYAVLEGTFELIVANAQHIKNVPGRKEKPHPRRWRSWPKGGCGRRSHNWNRLWRGAWKSTIATC